jgi:dTDP-3-amino-3,4,6-trideoxy-alpha-D-glucose transaminase
VSSGLDGLVLALAAAGLRAGDEVLVPANTFIATFEAISQLGGVPVPIDVTREDYNMDVAAADAAVGSSTRFVLPVHLYGQLADLDAIDELASRNDLKVVEDACQAHGAARRGRRPGDRSSAAVFSFYPAKNLGAMGDAGAVVSHDATLVERVLALREHGQREKYLHEQAGWTARLDAFQAAVLLEKLDLLDGWNAQRRVIAEHYLEELAGVGDLGLPNVVPESDHVWHLFVVATADPDEFAHFLTTRGIRTGRHYPEPPHLSAAFRQLGYRHGSFPVTEELASSTVSLPIFVGMTETEAEAVCEGVKRYFAHG